MRLRIQRFLLNLEFRCVLSHFKIFRLHFMQISCSFFQQINFICESNSLYTNLVDIINQYHLHNAFLYSCNTSFRIIKNQNLLNCPNYMIEKIKEKLLFLLTLKFFKANFCFLLFFSFEKFFELNIHQMLTFTSCSFKNVREFHSNH